MECKPIIEKRLGYFLAAVLTARCAQDTLSIIQMSESGRLIPPYVENWFARGLLIWRLEPDAIKTAVDFRQATEACLVGVALAAVVEYLVIFTHGPNNTFSQLLGLPVYAVSQILVAMTFVLLLISFLRAVGARIKAVRAASAALYTLSGLIPVIMILSIEVLNHAIDRLRVLHDPSNPYISASILDLVSSEGISPSLMWRVSIEMLFAALFILFLLARLRRLLISCSDHPSPKIRITLALLGAVIVQTAAFRYLFDRIYWTLVGKVIGV